MAQYGLIERLRTRCEGKLLGILYRHPSYILQSILPNQYAGITTTTPRDARKELGALMTMTIVIYALRRDTVQSTVAGTESRRARLLTIVCNSV